MPAPAADPLQRRQSDGGMMWRQLLEATPWVDIPPTLSLQPMHEKAALRIAALVDGAG